MDETNAHTVVEGEEEESEDEHEETQPQEKGGNVEATSVVVEGEEEEESDGEKDAENETNTHMAEQKIEANELKGNRFIAKNSCIPSNSSAGDRQLRRGNQNVRTMVGSSSVSAIGAAHRAVLQTSHALDLVRNVAQELSGNIHSFNADIEKLSSLLDSGCECFLEMLQPPTESIPDL